MYESNILQPPTMVTINLVKHHNNGTCQINTFSVSVGGWFGDFICQIIPRSIFMTKKYEINFFYFEINSWTLAASHFNWKCETFNFYHARNQIALSITNVHLAHTTAIQMQPAPIHRIHLPVHATTTSMETAPPAHSAALILNVSQTVLHVVAPARNVRQQGRQQHA